MAVQKSRFQQHKERYDARKAARGNWETEWERIARVAYPRMQSGFISMKTPGEDLKRQVLDNTAIMANEKLAAGLHGMMTNPATDWFEPRMEDEALGERNAAQEWMFHIKEVMMREMNRPEAQFVTSRHEYYKELSAFGNGVWMCSRHPITQKGLLFETRHLAECVLVENEAGVIDTLYRRFEWTVEKAIRFFGEKAVSAKVREKMQSKKWDELVSILHVIGPNLQHRPGSKSNKRLPFESTYIEYDTCHPLKESGYHEQPFGAARFHRAAGEVYGRGPGHNAVHDARMLQEMMRTTIKAAQKAVDPPLQIPDDAKMNPVRTIPGGVNYYRAGTKDRIETMPTASNPLLGEEIMRQVRERILEAFYIDLLQLVPDRPQMTATEVLQRTEETLRLLGPMLGRLQSEDLGPMLNRVYAELARQEMFDDPPPELEGVGF